MATTVKNPMHRYGIGYTKCHWCGNQYTVLGVSRHWDKCPVKPKEKPKS